MACQMAAALSAYDMWQWPRDYGRVSKVQGTDVLYHQESTWTHHPVVVAWYFLHRFFYILYFRAFISREHGSAQFTAVALVYKALECC